MGQAHSHNFLRNETPQMSRQFFSIQFLKIPVTMLDKFVFFYKKLKIKTPIVPLFSKKNRKRMHPNFKTFTQ